MVVAQIENGGGRRIEKRAYPKEAVREVIANALVHRDYLLSSTDIELSIYEDRLEIISPDRLPCRAQPNAQRHHARLPILGAFRHGNPSKNRQVHERAQLPQRRS
jgi:predicted HTH transcriptional regulator